MTAYGKNLSAVKSIVLDYAIEMQNSSNRLDAVFMVCGEEGSGKSNFVLCCMDYVQSKTGRLVPPEHITRSIKELVKALSKSKDKDQISMDEGSELASDNQYDRSVKALRRGFTVMRAKGLIVYMCFVNPFKMNTYWREDRSKGIFFVHRRKHVYYFSRSTFQRIQEEMRRFNLGIKSVGDFINKYGNRATIIDTVPLYKGELLKDYLERKQENIGDILEDLDNEFGEEDKTYSYNQTAKKLRISNQTLTKYIDSGFIEVIRTKSGRIYIAQDQYDKLYADIYMTQQQQHQKQQ